MNLQGIITRSREERLWNWKETRTRQRESMCVCVWERWRSEQQLKIQIENYMRPIIYSVNIRGLYFTIHTSQLPLQTPISSSSQFQTLPLERRSLTRPSLYMLITRVSLLVSFTFTPTFILFFLFFHTCFQNLRHTLKSMANIKIHI